MLEREKSQCCGCTACMKVCPTQAIRMKRDEKAFFYSMIDKKKCIQCGLCEKVCGFTKYISDKADNAERVVFAAKRKKKRYLSQSGGAFSAIAEYFLKNGWIVYGVANINNTNISYYRVDNMKELKLLRGSKYVQATVGNTFNSLITDLKSEKKVFFSGTPCHVDGLKCLLKTKKIDDKNLYTCDLICHGVVAPKIYQDYLRLIEKKYGKIKRFNFRNKHIYGWHAHATTTKTNRQYIISSNYANIFYSHLTLRESCYECPYACTERVGDISIGDFWGIEKINPDFDDNKGTSLIIINSKKGHLLWDWCKSEFAFLESSIKDCLQPNLQYPTEKPKTYNAFWQKYFNEGFENAVMEFCNFDLKNDTSMHIVSMYIFCLRKMIGKAKRKIINFIK